MKKVISFDAITTTAAERARKDQEYIDELAELYKSQCELPPLDVFGQKGDKTYWLADGFNRINAAKKAGLLGLECTIHDGDFEDALLFSAGANNLHGQRPSTADRRKKVTELLKSKRWKGKSDRWLADTCGVSPTTVGSLRSQLSNLDNCENGDGEKREGRDGGKYKAHKDKGKNGKDDKPKAGSVLFDFAAYFAHLNALRRAPDHMYRAHQLLDKHGAIKRDDDYDDISRKLEAYHAAIEKRWGYLAGKPFPKQ